MMFVHVVQVIVVLMLPSTLSLQYPANPTSDISENENNFVKDKKSVDDVSGHEIETEFDERDKIFLEEAMKTVLDPETKIPKHPVDNFKTNLDHILKENVTLEVFMEEMDNLSQEVCKTSQQALWSYVTDPPSEERKNEMIKIASEDDYGKIMSWDIIKSRYWSESDPVEDVKLKRKIRIIKERSLGVLKPHSAAKKSVDAMQSVWSKVVVCNKTSTHKSCNSTNGGKSLSDILAIFKTSNDSKELLYYWKAYQDATGKRIRPLFKEYVTSLNNQAKTERFRDAGEMLRYAFEDDDLPQTVQKLWEELKPLYRLLHNYTRRKLKKIYSDDFDDNSTLIPAHILGNLWAQEWQSIYPKVTAYPEHKLPIINDKFTVKATKLFEVIDDFYRSIGFETARDAYADLADFRTQINCLPSSHDMCDGVNYKIKWCGEEVTDITVTLTRVARLLGHVEYFKQYKNLSILYRDGPNPAFHDAVADVVTVAASSPIFLKNVNFIKTDTSPQAQMNHLLWLALEKIPLLAYSYTLEKWRWDVFSNATLENLNQYWWDLRIQETGIAPPIPRSEDDLDPVSKYHVVSHVPYITYFISTVLEFQILQALCRSSNHSGPLHECSFYGVKEAGKILRDGMSLGASENWRTVLETMTGESSLSSTGMQAYFAPLKEFLIQELAKPEDTDLSPSVPIIVGCILMFLICVVFIVFCVKKHNIGGSVLALCGLSKNGSLDIATNDLGQVKNDDVVGVTEAKV